MFAFGGDSRFEIYPLKYKGTVDSDDEHCGFTDFFKEEPIEIDVAAGLRSVPGCSEISSSLLCRDFCLTVGDGLVVLAASSPAECYEVEDKPPLSYLVRGVEGRAKKILNDSHTAFPCLDHVTFFLVSLKTMKVIDFLHFKFDFIYLAHHLGVGLEDDVFSVLSVKNQRLFLFEVGETEGFKEKTTIARNSFEEAGDGETTFSVPCAPMRDDSWGRPGINGFTLKLIKKLTEGNDLERIPLPYSILSSLHIWKHQLLPGNKILLRLSPTNLILSTNPRHQSMVHALDPLPSIHKNSYLVLYDLKENRVVSVVNSADSGLFEWIEDNWKWLRGSACGDEDFELLKLSMERNGFTSNNSISRRFTNLLPQSPQQLSTSVWLNSKILRWDPKITATLSRLAPISTNYFNGERLVGANGLYDVNYGPERVKFFSRSSDDLAYTLTFVEEEQPPADANTNAMDRHKWINVLMHPSLPLILIYQYGIFRSISLKIFYN